MVDSEKIENADSGSEEKKEERLNVQVEVEEVSSCERHVKVTVAREDVDRYIEKEYSELSKTVALPGFRIGKAPRRLVEKKFKDEVNGRVKSNLLLDSLTQVNETEDLTPISEPDLDIRAVVLPAEGPFVYEYNIEVRPVFDVPDWKGLKLEKPVREFSDADVDAAINRIRRNYGKLDEIEEPAQPGDYINCKLTFEHDGAVVSSSESETIRIRPTLTFHDSIIKDFDKLMTGAKPGDTIRAKTILSIDTPNAFLSGKEIEAIFEIKTVYKLSIPELDLSFVRTMGDFETLADFRDFVGDMLKRQLDHDQQQSARRQITEKLTVNAKWDLPPALLQRQEIRELQRASMEMKRSGFDDNQIRAQLNGMRQNIKSRVTQALKEHFILEKIAEIENVTDDPIDYDVEVALIAQQSGDNPRRVRAQIEKNGDMDILRNQIIERKVIKLIEDEATFTDVAYDYNLSDDEEAIDMAAGSDEKEEEIPDVSEDEVRQAAREAIEKTAMGLKD